MVVASSSNLVGTFDQLSRASMTMHDKANFTIAPIIYLFLKIEKNYLNLKKLRKKKKKNTPFNCAICFLASGASSSLHTFIHHL
jgi:hypothetical protein